MRIINTILGLAILALCGLTEAHAQTGQCMNFGAFTSCTDSTGRTGTWMDLGGGMQSYSDNRGATGQSMDLGNGMGSYQFQERGRSTNGMYQDMGGFGTFQDNHGGGTFFQYGHGMNSYQRTR